MTTSTEIFFLGVFTALCFVAGLYFLKFWRKTRDPLFLAFAASFFVRGFNDGIRVSMPHPNEATLWSFAVSAASSLLIVIAIVKKNLDG